MAQTSPDESVRLPGSARAYTHAELTDLFSAPDWGFHVHGPMPEVVAHGRRPEVRACGFCHTPTGQGRPENAALAGLPRAYIVAQLQHFRDGTRRGAWPGAYAPADLMILAAKHLTDDEIESVAEYFSQQRPVPRTQILESLTVPQSRVVGLVYVAAPGGGQEPLGDRLLEFAPDAERHEERDDAMRYQAYVPEGSLRRGRQLAVTGRARSGLAACSSCHGVGLHGVGVVPGIAGRSPTSLLRSLFAFRTGARGGPAASPMMHVAQQLSPDDLIDAAAYAGSLPP